ncbi:MAG: hypothetical protein ABI596_08025 [Pyrinomonadaceae bacterium]
MKTLALAVLLLITAGPAFTFENSSEWIKYQSAEGRYSILFPVQPTLSTEQSTTLAGHKLTQYRASAADGKATFFIAYYDYFSGTMFSFDKARDGIVGKIKGTLLSERGIKLEGHQGRELQISAVGPDGTELLDRARLYSVHRRIYVLQVITVKSEDDSASAEKANRYFASFQITKIH